MSEGSRNTSGVGPKPEALRGSPRPPADWIPDEAALHREAYELMYQPVCIGTREVGRVEHVEICKRDDDYPENHLRVTMKVEHQFVQDSILQVPHFLPTVKRSVTDHEDQA